MLSARYKNSYPLWEPVGQRELTGKGGDREDFLKFASDFQVKKVDKKSPRQKEQ